MKTSLTRPNVVSEKKEHYQNIDFKLLLVNDDENTFDWIMQSLIDICAHNTIQAEQCALIAHYKGTATIYTSDEDSITKMRKAFTSRGITTEIM